MLQMEFMFYVMFSTITWKLVWLSLSMVADNISIIYIIINIIDNISSSTFV